MEKTELPTAGRLAELRREGKFPYSPWATSALVLVGVLIGLLMVGKDVKDTIAIVKEVNLPAAGAHSHTAFLPAKGPMDVPPASITIGNLGLERLLRPVGRILLIPMSSAVAGWFLSWVFQARFAFHVLEVRFDLGRLFPQRPSRRVHQSGPVPSLPRTILILLLSLPLGVGLYVIAVREWLRVAQNEPLFVAELVPEYLKGLVLPMVVALLLLAGVAWTVARFRFLLLNRMSRQEVASSD